jgi:hypothetical protein
VRQEHGGGFESHTVNGAYRFISKEVFMIFNDDSSLRILLEKNTELLKSHFVERTSTRLGYYRLKPGASPETIKLCKELTKECEEYNKIQAENFKNGMF